MLLTNHLQATQSSTGLAPSSREAIVQFTLRQPVIKMTKGTVATDSAAGVFEPATASPVPFAAPPNAGEPFTAPITSNALAADPVDSDLSTVDAGDLVTFAIVLENSGGSGAFDLVVRDAIPAGLGIPSGGLHLTVRRGDGTALVPIFLGPSLGPSDLFANGLEIADPGGEAACQKFDAESGENVVVITYELEITDAGAAPAAVLANGASLESFTGEDGSSSSHLAGPGPIVDSAIVTIASSTIVKELISTSEPHTVESGAQWPVAVGEELHYRVTVTVPEGVDESVRLIDRLDAGLAVVSVDGLTPSSGLATDQPGGFQGVVDNAVISPDGRDLTFEFGTLTNANRDNGVAETVVFDYTVRVDDQAAIVQEVRRNNRADWHGQNGFVRDRAGDVRVVESVLTVEKSASPASADAGDTVTFTILIDHDPSSQTDAFDLAVEDLLTETDLSLVAGSVSSDRGTIVTGNGGGDETVRLELETLALGDSVTLSFDAQVADQVLSGSTLENSAGLIWDSLPADAAAGERSYGPLVDTASIAIDVPSLAKTVVETSEPSTGTASFDGAIEDLTIGELVVFEIVATVPEGTTAQVVIRDSLPAMAAGLLEATSAEVISVGTNLTAANPAPAPVFEDLNLKDGLFDTVSFDFGQVSNAPDMEVDAGDRLVVRITARAVDADANGSGDLLTNTALLDFSGSLQPSADASVEVVEPLLSLDKSADATTGDAGDSVVFTLTLEHQPGSSADAFDVELRDVIPAGMTLLGGTAVDTGSTPADHLSEGSTLVARWDHFPVGSVGSIEFTVTIDDEVQPGQLINNLGELFWDSLPEDNAATERDGTAGDGHDFMVTDPGVVKTVIQTSEVSTGSAVNGPETDLTLGETVTYEIVVTLPEGTTEAATVVDQLPTGDGVLALVSSRVLALGGQLDGPGLPAIGAAGSAADSDLDGHDDRVTWTLGNILNAPDGELDDGDRLRFEVVAVVVDEAVNQGGQDDDASNLATFGHAGGTSLDTALVDLVEPLLALTKGADQEFVDAGDALRYTLRLEHLPTSTADAFSLVVTDPLPAGVDWISTDEVTTDCAGLAVDDAAEPTLAFSLASLSLADGSCEIEFNVTVADTVQPTESLINNAQLQYDSQAVFTAGETRRSTADDNAEVTVLAPGLVKIITDTSLDATGSSFHDALEDDLAIGESIDYRLTAIFPEGQTLNAVVVDALPAGAAGLLEVIGASIVSVGDQIVTELPGTPVLSDDELADGLDDTVTFDFGTVTNAPDGFSDEHDRIVVSVTARVVDDAVNQDGRTLRNEAELRFASGPPLTDSVDAEVVEPDVVVSKTLGPVDDHVATVSIEIRNDGTAPAYDLQVEDVVDAEGWVPAEIVSVGVPAGFVLSSAPGPAPGDVRLTLSSDPGASPPMNSLEPGEAVIWSFTVPVRITDPPQASVDNTAANTVTTTLPGDVPGEREEPQGEDTAVLGLPILAVEKTAELIDDADASGTASPGDTLRYSVSLINTGDGAATDVSVVDVPDANGSLVVGTVVVSAGGAVVEGNGAGEESVAVTFAAVGAGQTATVSYQVLIEPLPIDVEALFNQAQVGLREEADDLVSDDPATASPDDPTEVAVEAAPDLRLMKSAGGAAEPGALLLYTLDYSNAGGQDAVGVEIEETVPAHSSFDAASSLPSVWSCADGSGPGTQCVLTVGALAAGGSGQASFAVHIAAGLPAGADTLDNVAEIRDDLSQGADLNPVDNVAELQTALGAEPAFNFTKSTSAVVAIPGVPLVFDLAYSNVGDQDATGVVLEETFPALTTFDAASSLPTVWSCADGSGPGTVCTVAIGALATGGSGDARFGVIPAGAAGDGQTVSNTAVIRDDGANSEDPVSAQQSAARPIKTLTLTKTRLSGAAVTVGQEVTYRIVARIPEGLSLGAVEIREDLPGQLWALRQDFGQALPGISLTGSTDPVNTGVALVWELGDVSNLDTDAGTDEVIESTYTTVMRNVASAVRGENVRNTVVITADGAELATASADVAVVEPGLTLRKDFAPGVAAAGDTVTVRLRIAHDSSSFVSAYDVEVIDVLDPALTYLGNVQAENGPLPTVDISQLPVVRLEWPELSNVAYHPNNPVIVTFDVQTSSSGRVDNVADLVWTSLAGDPGLADPEEQTTGERSGDSAAAGGGANTYRYRDADQLNNQLIYGFEDLKNDDTLFNDFDYNDWLLKVSLQETLDDDGNWRRLEFVVEGLGRGAGFNHLPFLDIGIEGPVSYTLSRFNSAGTLIFEQTRTSDGDFLRDVQLFADTWDTLPPWNLGNFPFAANTDPAQTSGLVTAGQTARLVVEVGEPERNPRIADDVVTVHLNETFNHLVGPWIDVLDTGERIAFRWRGSGATQDLVTADLYGPTTPLLGFPLDQGRAFEAVWRWPVEREPIWDAYPSFVDFILSGETQSTDWRLQPSAGLIWPVDVPPEAAAPVDAPNSGQACGAVAFDHAYGSPVSASPAIGDLDGDGDWEVVSAEFLGAVVIHDESGGTVRVIEPGSGVNGQSSASVTLADLDGDSDLEILRGYDDGHLIAFHHDGTEARRWWLPGSLKSTAAVGDLDGDGDLEIVVLAGDTKLYGLQAEGGEMAGFPVEIGGLEDIYNKFVLQPTPAVAEVVPRGDLEVVAENNLGVVH
ncbi:MAG: FG-GAP-like repeat-containing protein [Acidobacteriota bacterium]